MISVSEAGNGMRTVKFVLPLDEFTEPVSVVGDFNSWRPGTTELRKRTNGTRSALVKVAPGTVLTFRYLGKDGWFDDPDAHTKHGHNCVLTVD